MQSEGVPLLFICVCVFFHKTSVFVVFRVDVGGGL